MSSLALSLVLLIAIAIAAALLYNLGQSGWRRRNKTSGTGSGRRDNGAQRGEPRLGGESARSAASSRSAAFAAEDELTGSGLERIPSVTMPETGRLDEESGVGHGSAHPDEIDADSVRASTEQAALHESGLPASVKVDTVHTAATSASDLNGSSGGSSDGMAPGQAPIASPDAESAGDQAGMVPSTGISDRHPGEFTNGSEHPGGKPLADGPVLPGQIAATVADRQSAAPVGAASEPILSEVADCVIELVPEGPLSGERLQMIAMRMRRAGSKPVAFDARRVGAEEFEAPVTGQNYTVARVGVLLVNRHGALNAMEFSDFTGAVQTLAESLPAQVEIPAMGPVLAQARELDAICAQLDVQIGINVEAESPIGNGQLAAIAHDLELVEQISQRYVRLDEHGNVLFSLAFADVPERVTFLLDVPRVPAAMMPFEKMVQAAATCARRLGGSLVDDNGRTLSQASLAQIARQLGQRYESLEAIGLPAGSALACKVFN